MSPVRSRNCRTLVRVNQPLHGLIHALPTRNIHIDYLTVITEEILEPPPVRPAPREWSRRRWVKSKLTQRQARFAALTLHAESDGAAQEMGQRQSRMVEDRGSRRVHGNGINQLKQTPSHLKWGELPETERCGRLAPRKEVAMVKMTDRRGDVDDHQGIIEAMYPGGWTNRLRHLYGKGNPATQILSPA